VNTLSKDKDDAMMLASAKSVNLEKLQEQVRTDQIQTQKTMYEKESLIRTLQNELDTLKKEKYQKSSNGEEKDKTIASLNQKYKELENKQNQTAKQVQEQAQIAENANIAMKIAKKDRDDAFQQISKLKQDLESKSANNQYDKKKELDFKEMIEKQKKQLQDQTELVSELAKSLESTEIEKKDATQTIKSQEEIMKLQQTDIEALIKEKDAALKKIKELTA